MCFVPSPASSRHCFGIAAVQYTSRAAHQYKTTLEKELARVNAGSAECPTSPTAAQAAKQGLDLLAASVRPLSAFPLFSPPPVTTPSQYHGRQLLVCHVRYFLSSHASDQM